MIKLAKWLTILAAATALVLFALWWINAPQPMADDSATAARVELGDYDVSTTSIDIIDQSRATPALGKYEGSDSRSLQGTIWYPKLPKNTILARQHPLIVFSHGFGSYHQGCRHIAEYLARNGYIVASVDFPLSNMRSPAGTPQLLDVANQPGDVSAVIDHVLELNDDASHPLHKRVLKDSIGAMGLSLGGLTTALVSFHPSLGDKRIDAAIMLAPPLEAFSRKFFDTRPELPSMIISGSYDRIVPEQANATEVQRRQPNGWFVSLDKGSHLGFATMGAWLRWTNSPDDLGCAVVERNLRKLTLPEQWSEIIPNPNGELREVQVGEPCPEIDDKAMNATRQHWLTLAAAGAFFDTNLRNGEIASEAKAYLNESLAAENSDLTIRAPLFARVDDSF